jgi:glutathione-independent formaldehyde dehydrogenase
MLADIFPTGYHGCVTAGVTTGSTVYIAGAGPVGLAAATSAFLLGASVVVVGDTNKDRLEQARSFGCETIDVSQGEPKEQLPDVLRRREVDCSVDAVGFEAHGHGAQAETNAPATVLNSLMETTRAGGGIGIPGLYVTGDPGAPTEEAKHGTLALRFGLGWSKSHSFATGQTPAMRYNRGLKKAILNGRTSIARNVNAKVIPLEQAPQGYAEFDRGMATKFVLDPHGLLH